MGLNVNMKKGGLAVKLHKDNEVLNKIRIECGWDAGNNNDLDLVAFLMKPMGNSNLLTSIEDVVSPYKLETDAGTYYAKQSDGTFASKCKSVISLGDNLVGNSASNSGDVCETLKIDLQKLVQNGYVAVRIAINLFLQNSAAKNLGGVKNAFLRVMNDETNVEIAKGSLDFDSHKYDVSVDVCEIVMGNGKWEINPTDRGYDQEVHAMIANIS